MASDVIGKWIGRFGRCCHYCGCNMHTEAHKPAANSAARATVDHVVPRSRGGTRGWDNVQVICRRCNNDKASLTHYEYLCALEGRVRFELTSESSPQTMLQVHARLYRDSRREVA